METELVKVLQLKYPIISYTNKLYEGNKKTLLTQTLHRKTLKLLRKIKKIFKPVAATNLASLGRSLRSYFVTIIRTLYLFQWNIYRNLDCHRSRRQTNFFFLHIYARSSFTWNEAWLVSSNSKSFFSVYWWTDWNRESQLNVSIYLYSLSFTGTRLVPS